MGRGRWIDMKTDSLKSEHYAKLIESARKIGKLAESEVLEAEDKCTISKNVVDLIVEEGINRLIIPKEYGFPQIDFTTYADMIKEVGYYNLSAAWLTYFYSLHNSWVSYLPKHRMDEIYNDGGLIADIFAPVGRVEKVAGGYILNGKWNYVSGINYSDWVSLGALYFTDPEKMPTRLGMCMRVSELEIIQDWNPMGLRGSGSNSVVAKDLFIPNDMVINMNDWAVIRKPRDLELSDDYLFYNRLFFPTFYMGFGAMSIGAAERVVTEFVERTKGRVRLDGSHEGQTSKAQRVAAELTLQLKQAKGLLKEYIEMLETDDGQFDPGEYNAIRVQIVKICLDIAVRATSSLGATALAKGNVVEVMTRDLIAISTHITSIYEDGIDNFGKSIFGIQTMATG